MRRRPSCSRRGLSAFSARAAAGNVTHAVKLLDAETPFMQQSGAKRIRRLAATGLAGEELRRENAPAKLLGLLHAGADPGQPGKCPKPLRPSTYEGATGTV